MMVQPEQPKAEGKEDEYGKGTQCKREMSLKRRGRDGNEAERGGEGILHQLSIPSSMGYAHQCADLGTEVALGT